MSKSPDCNMGQYIGLVFWNQYCPPQSRSSALSEVTSRHALDVLALDPISMVKIEPLNLMG